MQGLLALMHRIRGSSLLRRLERLVFSRGNQESHAQVLSTLEAGKLTGV